MTTASATVNFGRIAPPTARVGEDYRGRVLYLPELQVIVAVEAAGRDGWWCRVLARRPSAPAQDHIRISAAVLATGHTNMHVDADADPDGLSMVWLARVWVTWPGGRTAVLARALLDEAWLPDQAKLVLTDGACRRLFNAAHVSGPGLRQLLDRLVSAGFLTADITYGHGDGAAFGLLVPGMCL